MPKRTVLHNVELQAIVMLVHAPSPKDGSRILKMINANGSTNIRIGPNHASSFSHGNVGQMISFANLTFVGTDAAWSLSMQSDSTATFETHPTKCPVMKWWHAMLQIRPMCIVDVRHCDDGDIVNVSGMVCTVTSDFMKINSEEQDCWRMKLVDKSAFIDVVTRNPIPLSVIDQPVLLQRAHVTTINGLKSLEVLMGTGSQWQYDFTGAAELKQFWNEYWPTAIHRV